jgi:hypothetical protein
MLVTESVVVSGRPLPILRRDRREMRDKVSAILAMLTENRAVDDVAIIQPGLGPEIEPKLGVIPDEDDTEQFSEQES